MPALVRLSWVCAILSVVRGYDPFPINLSAKDQCVNLCQSEKLPTLEPDNFESIVCQSGCRFFSIIKISRGFEINPAIKHCHITCNESYSYPNERKVCTTGCELVASKTEIDAEFLIQTDEDESHKLNNELVLGEPPDSDLLEAELLSDPSLRSQLEVGLNADYKIPETHIRTMPIIEDSGSSRRGRGATSGDWLDCASRNSGVPRWILLSIMLGTVVVAIWLTLSIESRKGAEDAEEVLDLSSIESYVIEKERFLDDVAFVPPPKYSEISDHPPPRYSDVVGEENTA